jgi:photosynthetic reaction center cytochrome c subunit
MRVRILRVLIAAVAGLVLAGCERPPVDTVQHGYRGTGMLNVYNPRDMAVSIPANQPPPVQPAAGSEGPKAGQIYQNLKVLGNLSIAEFTRQMAAMTAWVAPDQGCAYCHNLQNLADDSLYTKVVSRRMLEMTQQVNSQWKTHVVATGVTCYTCHRGNNIPTDIWFQPTPQGGSNFIGDQAGQNQGLASASWAALPYDPFTPYLLNEVPIRIQGATPLPTGNTNSIVATEGTYSLMNHMSTALGVNCTYCHNSRSFFAWDQSSPQRVTAYYGVRMARELNNKYMVPLTATFPAHRKGPTGDVAKVNCRTCHQGAFKPLYGAQMAKDYPALLGPLTPAAAALPAPLAEAMHSVMYFDVGSAALQGEQAKGMAQVVVSMAGKPALKATISGYHSASGTLVQNQELAKQRAFSVRDQLMAAGIAADRVVLDKPQQTKANASGEDFESRRVEVSLK